jgi:hypothetical protein
VKNVIKMVIFRLKKKKFEKNSCFVLFNKIDKKII